MAFVVGRRNHIFNRGGTKSYEYLSRALKGQVSGSFLDNHLIIKC